MGPGGGGGGGAVYHGRMERATAAWRITGRVQGVGYRYFVVREAGRLHLTGWTCNHRDGSVEVQACGPPEALRAFEGILRQGPPHARVAAVETASPSQSLERAAAFTIEYFAG